MRTFFIMINLSGCYLMGFLKTPLALKISRPSEGFFRGRSVECNHDLGIEKAPGPDGFNIALWQGHW